MTQSALQAKAKLIGQQATVLQDTASDPQKNVWVGASAGTGKTKVLTERVLRLLLPSQGHVPTEPEKILCITYTKAGANEMIGRIMQILSEWAVCDDTVLDEKLARLLGEQPTLQQRDRARRLFALVIDTPGGLKVTTIHAFCQSVLGRFPIEAGLSPQFQVIEEGEAASLVKQARDKLILDIRNNNAPDVLKNGFYRLSQWKNGDQINKIIKAVLNDREKLNSFREQAQGTAAAVRMVYDRVNAIQGQNVNDIIRTYISEDNFPADKIKKLALALSNGTATNQNTATFLYNFCASDQNERIGFFQEYQGVFLKQDGGMKNLERSVTAKAHDFDPTARDLFMEEAGRMILCVQAVKSLTIAQATESLLYVGHDLIDRYTALKNQKNALDYDDLIFRTRDLLTHKTVNGRDMTDWVLYKMDGGVDHVLVDEAQDTSPAQWQIILQIIDEFFSGLSARDEMPRTIFVVGDDKQSIFSFQGADPANFESVRRFIGEKVEQANRVWEEVPMATSFRSVDAVLSLTDAVFADDEVRRNIVQNPTHKVEHIAFRQGHSGRVEIWPPYKTPPKQDRDIWEMPIKVKQAYDAQAALAGRIAASIKEWIDSEEQLKARGRSVRPGDIMILVRRRNALVDHLVRALKDRHIPVSGADRMVVTDQIAVQDVLAVLAFALMPDDDLSLAAILKSPFIGWDDDILLPYAYERTGSLWHSVKDKAPSDVVEWLSRRVETVSAHGAFTAISNVLTEITPNEGKNGWQAVLGRLGQDALDPLQELLTLALDFDHQNPASGVQGFVHKMDTDSRDIKRELDDGQNQVRIMTVHASKGLQSPIVILPDTTAVKNTAGQSDGGFIWDKDNVPLWTPSADDENDLYAAIRDGLKAEDNAEYCRLLYVALTRAEDRLIICGTLNQKNKSVPEGSWYDLVHRGFKKLDNDLCRNEEWKDDVDYLIADHTEKMVYETPQEAEPKAEKEDDHEWHDVDLPALPLWAKQAPMPEQYPPRHLAPSRPSDTDSPVRSPLSTRDDTQRFSRGLLTHSLLQYLPELPVDKRAEAAKAYLDIHGTDVSEDIRADIIRETMAILQDDEFSPFFAANSQAEVPITGMVTNTETGKTDIISGQIDRLVVSDDTIWIVDYKSNRPSPKTVQDVPAIYRNQLKAYKVLIGRIYPDHHIRCALLWTDVPVMMELKDV